jgi:uncharacterized protein (TIGR03382 family)
MTRWGSRHTLVGFASMLACFALTARDASAFCQATTACSKDATSCDRDEKGCSKGGTPLRWPKLPLTYRFSAAREGQLVREDARAAIREAFNRWSDTLCGPKQERTSLRFVEGEDIAEDKPLVANSQGTEPFGIYFRDRGWPYEGKQDATLAQTNTLFGRASGVIGYADIEINTATKRFSTDDLDDSGNDLQAVMTHEVGHFIGLDHSKEPQSIMVWAYCDPVDGDGRCEKGKVAARRLAEDDVNAVCALYPPTTTATTAPVAPWPAVDTPGAGCSAGGIVNGNTHPARGTAALVGLALAAMIVRRRRV